MAGIPITATFLKHYDNTYNDFTHNAFTYDDNTSF